MGTNSAKPIEAPVNEDVAAQSSGSELPPARPSLRPRYSQPPASFVPIDVNPPSGTETRELEYWRLKAIELDGLVFEMRALLQSGKGFSEALHIDPLLKMFMAVCRERYGAVSSAVLLLDDLDPDNVFYRVRAYHGLPDYFTDRHDQREETMMFKIPHDEGLLWQLIHQGDVFSVRDMSRRPRFKTAFRHWRLDVLQSDIWVPLIRGGGVLGILTLGEREDGSQIPEDEYAFVEEIASVAATNIDSALKYEKNARILENLRTLYDVNQQLANVNDFKNLTIETLAKAVTALRAQKANLMLYNRDADRLEIKVVWGNIPAAVRDSINEGRTPTKSFAIGEGVAGRAAKERRPVRINDRDRIEQVGKNVVYCILAAPLLHGGEVMGVMTLTNKVKETEAGLELDPLGRFGEDDSQLLLGLADQAAVNLHKARLYNASITDRLTELYNARHFETVIESTLESARGSGRPFTLAITDIDKFKVFNDTHGHKAGDAVLAHVAQILRGMVRPGTQDAAFRYGGEEFCLLLPSTEGDAAGAILDAFRAKVEAAALDYDGKALRVTISAGIATFPSDGETRPTLFESADKALYASKSGGRNQVTRAAGGRLERVEVG
jgi:diguanylate cyclase (GGDEF)-like protein